METLPHADCAAACTLWPESGLKMTTRHTPCTQTLYCGDFQNHPLTERQQLKTDKIMENKIEELTGKLLSEGVEKGKAEAARIVEEAHTQASEIVKSAKEQAEQILADAKKEARNTQVNTQAELKMFNAQALNALKTEVANIVTDKVVKETASSLASDQKFMNEFMFRLAEKWGAQEDIVISTAEADTLKAYFAKKAKDLLDGGVKIAQVNGQKTDFTVEPADGSYKVKFGEEEFEAYFRQFLRPQLADMLF